MPNKSQNFNFSFYSKKAVEQKTKIYDSFFKSDLMYLTQSISIDIGQKVCYEEKFQKLCR